MKTLTLHTKDRTDFMDITVQVQAVADELGMKEGGITIFVPHTTAGITINENADPEVVTDIKSVLEDLAPWRGRYRHGEGNSAAHIKASLMGSSVRVPVEKGRLKLGIWQAIYFCEFDGPRRRLLWIA